MPNKKDATAVVVPTILASISVEDASALDQTIDAKIQEVSVHLARAYVEVGVSLNRMRAGKGFHHLGFDSWEAYLDSKNEFGRTYLSYLYKLGQAGELQGYLDRGISGTKLVEFAKRTDYPEKIPKLIDATWERVKDESVRKTGEILNEYVAEHKKEFKKQTKRTGAGRPKTTWLKKFEDQFNKLSSKAEKKEFIADLSTFLESIK